MPRATAIACLGLALLTIHPLQAQQQQKQKIRRQRNVITAEEIATRPGEGNALDLIRSLRPAWLTSRGVASGNISGDGMGGVTDNAGMAVYVDGVKMGGVDQLGTIEADRIQELRFLSASDATQKYGTGNTAGAIEVTTKH
jgi:outer membrane receptor protein involved in Fe transport